MKKSKLHDAGGGGEGLSAVAKALGLAHQQLSREARDHKGFPFMVKAGRRVYDVEKVRAWRRRNIKPRPRGRKLGEEVKTPAVVGGVGSRQLETLPVEPAQTSEIMKVLQSGNASALEISRAVVQLVSQRVAKDDFSANDVDALKKALGELRQAESDYLELAERTGRLIDRDVVKRLVGECCARLVRCLGVVESAISTEFSVWLADPTLATMPADQRARKVREFVGKTCREVRRQEAEGVDKLIDDARKDDE
jgi:hypothetical protein